MTKKLEKMMKSPSKKKKRARKTKRIPAKERARHRGIVFSVGEKRAMEILYDMIKTQRHKVPVINLYMDDPAADFCINMYAEIASWDYHVLIVFIEEITGKKPAHTEIASLLGTAKSIFHALFMDEDEATKEQLLRYDSKWKMWPGKIRLKPKRRKSKMATNKNASRKKTSSKRAAAKKTGRRKVSKKKTTKRKSGGGRLSPITDDTKLVKKKASCGESEAWDDVLDCLPKKAVSFATLCDTVNRKLDGDDAYTRRVVGSLRRRGCIAAVD
jgi:hypothetical protein